MNYLSFTRLFGEDGILTLADGMIMDRDACAILEEVFEDALNYPFATLSGGRAVEALNRNQVISHRVPRVRITVKEAGVLQLPLCQFKLLSFDEVVQKLAPDFEMFNVFLSNRNYPYRESYRYNLNAWQRMDAAMMLDYREWLSCHLPSQEHHPKLAMLLMYCQLANKDEYLSNEELKSLVDASEKPLQRQKRRR